MLWKYPGQARVNKYLLSTRRRRPTLRDDDLQLILAALQLIGADLQLAGTAPYLRCTVPQVIGATSRLVGAALH